MKTMTCDGCGRSDFREGLVNWYELDRLGMFVGTFADRTGPWDFCSVECVMSWASHRLADMAGVSQGADIPGGTDA